MLFPFFCLDGCVLLLTHICSSGVRGGNNCEMRLGYSQEHVVWFLRFPLLNSIPCFVPGGEERERVDLTLLLLSRIWLFLKANETALTCTE